MLQEVANARIGLLRCRIPGGLDAMYARAKGRPMIALSKSLGTAEATCGCARALGHHYTGAGNALGICALEAERQARGADRWAHERLIPLETLAAETHRFDGNLYAVAEALEVTERFLLEAIEAYRDRYGVSTAVDGYVIQFEPFFSVRRG